MSKSIKPVPAAPSFVRTLVPFAVGQIVSFAATLGIEVTEDQETAFTVVLGFIVAAVYYVVVRFVEQKWPKVGILLGWWATPDGYTSAKVKGAVESEVVQGYDPKH